jgi:hypothetical protein
MSETPNDPAGTTHQFQSFAGQGQPDRTSKVNKGLIVGAVALVALVALLLIAFMLL